MSVLSELQESVVAVGPSVVGIGSRLRGSGVVIVEGRVLTNAHNLRGGEVTVRSADGRTGRGTARGVDWDGDLAVVEADTTGVPPIAWSSATAIIGSAVFAAAATPTGGARVSFGFVSSVERPTVRHRTDPRTDRGTQTSGSGGRRFSPSAPFGRV